MRKIALAGNPNVGKSTLFNTLTGMRQHTGNWPGKTVALACGKTELSGEQVEIIDLPGTYSLSFASPEEEIASALINSADIEAVIIVVDATNLERSLGIALQVIATGRPAGVCVNLMKSAERQGIAIDLDGLSNELSVPVEAIDARDGRGFSKLLRLTLSQSPRPKAPDTSAQERVTRCEAIVRAVQTKNAPGQWYHRRVDKILTSKRFGIPIMIAFFALIFWLTVTGANYPSRLLSNLFESLGDEMLRFLEFLRLPPVLVSLLTDGAYRTLSWVVAVMLPPMAIFFPLFTILEDSGYLARIAFNLDSYFQKACACGKQALTMCMGFGCNAAGVTGCRIISSPRERLIAILTNNFVPCNGRFPLLIAVSGMFFGVASGSFGSVVSTGAIVLAVILGVGATLAFSKILFKTVLKGLPSSFVLELPQYRRPQLLKVLLYSIVNRTVFVLLRAVVVSAPAGAVIWLLGYLHIGDLSILETLRQMLAPLGNALGLDGAILLAFILGLPANEIVLPLTLMIYLSGGTLVEPGSLQDLRTLLIDNGWTALTAINVMLFSLFHFPCATTLWTIQKETGAFRWTALAFALPTLTGVVACLLTTGVYRLVGG